MSDTFFPDDLRIYREFNDLAATACETQATMMEAQAKFMRMMAKAHRTTLEEMQEVIEPAKAEKKP